jgi:hypothetical protein
MATTIGHQRSPSVVLVDPSAVRVVVKTVAPVCAGASVLLGLMVGAAHRLGAACRYVEIVKIIRRRSVHGRLLMAALGRWWCALVSPYRAALRRLISLQSIVVNNQL